MTDDLYYLATFFIGSPQSPVLPSFPLASAPLSLSILPSTSPFPLRSTCAAVPVDERHFRRPRYPLPPSPAPRLSSLNLLPRAGHTGILGVCRRAAHRCTCARLLRLIRSKPAHCPGRSIRLPRDLALLFDLCPRSAFSKSRPDPYPFCKGRLPPRRPRSYLTYLLLSLLTTAHR